jgi:hypothetical protein
MAKSAGIVIKTIEPDTSTRLDTTLTPILIVMEDENTNKIKDSV